ncbi:histidine kinase [Actinoplanes sp. NPDC049802]|uniref:sensor histidine kinase n=1 Tax=Actinoplanes sp. NPDC049802 TaxID=3154742 RepID=UPI0033F58540
METSSGRRVRLPGPWLTTGVVAGAFAGGLIGTAHILSMPGGPGAGAVWFGCVLALVAPQLVWFFRGDGTVTTFRGYLVLAAQAVLAYLPLFLFGQPWVSVPGFLAGGVLLALPARPAWTAITSIVASTAIAQWTLTGRPIDVIYTAVSTIAIGAFVFGLSHLVTLVRETRESRARIARAAAMQERLRFARDLHDLLGYSLSAISHKIELVHRIMETSPDLARDHLRDALEISRAAYSDARMVASGYRELSLEEECRSVVSVLSAAGIRVDLDCGPVDMPVKISTVLATVLREGVTNLMRHSKATRCRITIGQTCDRVWIEIVNDRPAAAPREPRRGPGRDGLRNLSARAAELGGAVTVDRPPGHFRLLAEVPLRADGGPATESEPARFAGDPDGVDSVTGGELADDRRQIVPDRSD